MLQPQPLSASHNIRTIYLTTFLVFLLALALYSVTVRSNVGPSLDSTELHLAVVTNGVAHPPGSPQYLALGRLATTVLPGPDPAYRLNLFNALCMAAAVGMLHLLTYRLTRHNIISALVSLVFAVAPRIWYLGSVTELYALNSLYLVSVLNLLITWHQTRRAPLYWGATILYALSFGNHTSMLMVLPAFVFTVLITDHRMLTRPRNLLLTILIVLIAALQYLQVPLRMAALPAYCNFCPAMDTPGQFVSFVTGGPFKEAFFALPEGEILRRISESIQQFNIQFMPWGFALGIVGIWEMLHRDTRAGWILLLALLAEWTFIMGYGIPDWHDFLSPSYVIFTPFIGYGAARAWEAFFPRPDPMGNNSNAQWGAAARRFAGPLLALAILASLTLVGIANYPNIDENTSTDWKPMARTLLARSAPEAWVLMPPAFSAAYYYSYSIPYYAYEDHVWTIKAVPPPEYVLPLGNNPLYIAWKSVRRELESEALAAASEGGTRRKLFVIDPSEERFADWGLLPVCVPDQELIAGYEVVAVREDSHVIPLIDPDRWDAVEQWVVFNDATAHCPDEASVSGNEEGTMPEMAGESQD